MKIPFWTLVVFSLVSQVAYAESIRSIRVFQNDANIVANDAPVPRGATLLVFNMDDKERAEAKLTAIIRERVKRYDKRMKVSDAYQKAFSELQNSPEWQSVYQELVDSGAAEEKAVRFSITKVPAVVFNDRDVVYGVRSLAEAIRIYQRKGGQR